MTTGEGEEKNVNKGEKEQNQRKPPSHIYAIFLACQICIPCLGEGEQEGLSSNYFLLTIVDIPLSAI